MACQSWMLKNCLTCCYLTWQRGVWFHSYKNIFQASNFDRSHSCSPLSYDNEYVCMIKIASHLWYIISIQITPFYIKNCQIKFSCKPLHHCFHFLPNPTAHDKKCHFYLNIIFLLFPGKPFMKFKWEMVSKSYSTLAH